MGIETVTLNPFALTDVESARDYLGLTSNDDDAWITVIVNEATALLERRTRRKLKSRAYDGMQAPLLLLDGDGSNSIVVPEYPVTAISSARYRDVNDVYTAIVITSARLYESGIVELPQDFFPKGSLNIELKVTAGFTPATHSSELAALENAAKRIVQVVYQDWRLKLGRGTGLTVEGLSLNLINRALPYDVESVIDNFARLV